MIVKLAARGDYFNKMLRSPNKPSLVKKFGFNKASNAMLQSIDHSRMKNNIAFNAYETQQLAHIKSLEEKRDSLKNLLNFLHEK